MQDPLLLLLSFLFVFFFFETESHFSLYRPGWPELEILLPQSPECWDHRCAWPCLAACCSSLLTPCLSWIRFCWWVGPEFITQFCLGCCTHLPQKYNLAKFGHMCKQITIILCNFNFFLTVVTKHEVIDQVLCCCLAIVLMMTLMGDHDS
jgi:hypothetical protein